MISTTYETRPDHAREIRYALTDAAAICERLGLLAGRKSFVRQPGGVIIRCPWHEDRTPSCSVRRGPDGTIAIRCHGCGQTGDVLSLVAVVNGLSTRSDFRDVLRAAAELGGLHAVAQELQTGIANTAPRPTPVAPPPEPERTYPDRREVMVVWQSAIPVTEDSESKAMLESRKLDPELVAADDLARVLRPDAALPRWASYRGDSQRREPWTKTGHRLIVPMRGVTGEIVSVRAWRVVDGESPKRLPPGGHKATGLVMADPFGIAMLKGTARPARVVIAEGEPDFLSWAIRGSTAVTAKLGIVSGSWTQELAARIPDGAEVFIWTDRDEAGDKYAQSIWQSLAWRCFLLRGGTRG